jgi:hypothetical protein
VGTLVSFLTVVEMISVFSPFSMMLDIVWSYIVFIMLRFIPCVPSFLIALIMKWRCVLLKPYSESIEMVNWFLSLLLLMYCVIFMDLCMLTHTCFNGMKPAFFPF